MLRIACATLALATTAFAHVMDMEAQINVMDGSSDDIVISYELPVKSTSFSFTIGSTSDITDETWVSGLEFGNFASNSTNKYIQAVSGCMVGSTDVSDKVSLKHDTFGDRTNSTLTFSVTASDFVSFDTSYTYTVICDVTYGFKSSSSDTAAVSAFVKPMSSSSAMNVAHDDDADHYFATDDVDFPTTRYGTVGTVNIFTVSINHATSDLTSYAEALYNKIVADLDAIAEEHAHEDEDDHTHYVAADDHSHAHIEVKGGVQCGMSSVIIGTGSGYACQATLTLTSDDMDEIATEIQTQYPAKLIAEMSLPEGTSAESVFKTHDINGSCTNNVKDMDTEEADVDCGFEACFVGCGAGLSCTKAVDCTSFICIDGKCANGAGALSIAGALAVIGAVVALVM